MEKLVCATNQRFIDLSLWCSFNLALFRAGPDERHANMTGELRRQLTSFLWIALLDLQLHTLLDNDMIGQAVLIQLRGINMPKNATKRTKQEIQKLVKLRFQTGIYVSQALAISINTIFHRLMRHVG